MNELINTLIKSQTVASVYSFPNEDTHLTGMLIAYDEENLLVAHISAHGFYDGYILIPAEDIFRIDYDGEYEKRMKMLYEAKQQSHVGKELLVNQTESLNNVLLGFAKEHGMLVSLEFEETMLSGKVLEVRQDEVKLQVLDMNGRRDGISVIKIDSIWRIAVDTDDEQDLAILSQQNGVS